MWCLWFIVLLFLCLEMKCVCLLIVCGSTYYELLLFGSVSSENWTLHGEFKKYLLVCVCVGCYMKFVIDVASFPSVLCITMSNPDWDIWSWNRALTPRLLDLSCQPRMQQLLYQRCSMATHTQTWLDQPVSFFWVLVTESATRQLGCERQRWPSWGQQHAGRGWMAGWVVMLLQFLLWSGVLVCACACVCVCVCITFLCVHCYSRLVLKGHGGKRLLF